MVAAHEETRHDQVALADGLLSLFGHKSPDRVTTGTAMTVAELVMRVNAALTRK